MLTKNDKLELREMITGLLNDFKVELRDEMHAMETRLHHRIVSDIGAIIDEGILPQIGELRNDIKRIKPLLYLV